MVLLSHHGLSAATIAELLGCDPATVRRWIHCEDVAEVLAPPV
jgi:DNA-directed RNA polymerase specialized sigma24 family protein